MCDLLSDKINSNILNYKKKFEKNKFIYIDDFIKNSSRLKILKDINEKEDKYKKYNENSFLSILGQLDAKNNKKNDNILKQHYVIAGNNIKNYFKMLSYYYHNCFADIVSKIVGVNVFSVNESFTMNNSLIIYEKENDSLRWHTDKSMFNGKKVYTLLIYLYNKSSQNLCYIDYNNKKECIFTKENSCVILEHFILEHAVTPLKKNEKKIVWSMTFAEDMNIDTIPGYLKNKAKNVSYLGTQALNYTDIFCLIIFILFIMYILFPIYYYIKNSNKSIKSKKI